jgi:hypothetical protein
VLRSLSVRRVVLPFTLAMLGVACNALTGVGKLGIDDDTGAASTDARPSDASSDGGASNDGALTDDGGSINVIDDAGSDGGADADAAPLGFCASLIPAAALCTDFDDAVFPGPWTPTTSGVATASLVTSTFRSSPRALHLGSAGGTLGTAYLSHTFATVAQSEVVLSFAVRAGQQRPIENELAVIHLGSAGGHPYQVQFELLDNGALNFEEEAPESDGGVPEKNDALGVTLPLAVWTRITITLTIGTTSSSATFAVEGSAPVTKSALAHNYKAAPRVVIGHDSTTTAAYGMDYDDIFVRVK